jgi:predicted RNase H-like HicB family nuclease
MRLTVEFDREVDGRWIAEIPQLPGVMVYGTSRDDAYRQVRVLALRVLADRMERDEREQNLSSLDFEPLAAAG